MTRSRAGEPASTTHTGALAETVGQRFLEQRGLRLVTRNYRCRYGEIDLIMMEGRDLIMVEVRYRASAALVDPTLTVTSAKRRRLAQTAQRYLQDQPRFADHSLRFDVLAISGPLRSPRCKWWRSAFTTDDLGRW